MSEIKLARELKKPKSRKLQANAATSGKKTKPASIIARDDPLEPAADF